MVRRGLRHRPLLRMTGDRPGALGFRSSDTGVPSGSPAFRRPKTTVFGRLSRCRTGPVLPRRYT